MNHFSDCAVHNAPALPKGPCDCGAVEAEAARKEYEGCGGISLEKFKNEISVKAK